MANGDHELHTTNSTFRQLLGNGLTYHVPPFQRDYSWGEDEWDDLWQDILGLFEEEGEPAHYMGYLVLQSSDSKRFDIIDGQQRMTTISIMVLASLSYLLEMHPDSGQNFAAFIDSLVDKLFFTVITVTDELNAFKVFETLNARGVRLSATDLLKNYLFSLISTDAIHATAIQSLEDRWEHIVGLLGSESFPEFLRVFWNSRNRLVRKTDLFKAIRRHITTREGAFTLVRDLDYCADIYSALRDPQDARWSVDERQALKQLVMFGVRQPLAMLLACYQRFFDAERSSFTRILRAIAVISLRYNVICNLPTHEQETLYNEIGSP